MQTESLFSQQQKEGEGKGAISTIFKRQQWREPGRFPMDGVW